MGDDGDGSSGSSEPPSPPPRRGLRGGRNEKEPGGAAGPGKQKVRRTQSMNLEYNGQGEGNTKEHSDQLVNALLGNPNDSGVGFLRPSTRRHLPPQAAPPHPEPCWALRRSRSRSSALPPNHPRRVRWLLTLAAGSLPSLPSLRFLSSRSAHGTGHGQVGSPPREPALHGLQEGRQDEGRNGQQSLEGALLAPLASWSTNRLIPSLWTSPAHASTL